MDRLLSPDDVEALATSLVDIPGYSQFPGGDGWDEEFIPLNFKALDSFVSSVPIGVLAERASEVYQRRGETSLNLRYRLQAGLVSASHIRRWIDLVKARHDVHHSVQFKVWATPSKQLGTLEFSFEMSWDHNDCFAVHWMNGFSSSEAEAATGRAFGEYKREVGELLSGCYSKLKLQGAGITERGTFFSEGKTDVAAFWDAMLGIDWLRPALLKAEIWPWLIIDYAEGVVSAKSALASVKELAGVMEGSCGALPGSTCLNWRGFRQLHPDWLKMGAFVAGMEPTHYPVEMPLGYISTTKSGSSRVPLILYTFEAGSVLAVRGGNDKLRSTLSQHFGAPWVKGETPIPISGKLGTPPFDEPPPDWRVPAVARKIPPFFTQKSAENEEEEFAEFLKVALDVDYLEHYPDDVRERAISDFRDGYPHARVPDERLNATIERWHEPEEWTEDLATLINEIAEASYGLFTPKNITIEFEDEEVPPDSGSEVRIGFDFAGKTHQYANEFYPGAIPHLLLPFLWQVMEENSNGVALRQIFKGKAGYALCTASALGRLKKALDLA